MVAIFLYFIYQRWVSVCVCVCVLYYYFNSSIQFNFIILGNWDLYLLARKYGHVVSVHIMVNKETGLSRGFGFISFYNPEDANACIDGLNGLKIGSKRLKVQHKKTSL